MQHSSPRFTRSILLVVALIAAAALNAFSQPDSKWVKLKPAQSPSPRAAAAMAYDPISQKIVLVGGFGSTDYFDETWTFDGTNWTQVMTTDAPSARAGASMAYDKWLQKLVLFGGFNGQYLGDTWTWDGATSTWTQMNPTKGTHPETLPMVFPDPLSGRVDNFGGWDGQFYSLTTWRWRSGNWHNVQPDAFPSARGAAVYGTDPEHKQTVMFGGLADVNPVNTWTFDGSTWTQQFPNNQIPYRFFAGEAYDPRFHGVIVFGGFSGQDVKDTWLWTGDDWMQLFPKQSPSVRETMGMAFDELHQQTVIFGGLRNGSLLNDTWVLKTK